MRRSFAVRLAAAFAGVGIAAAAITAILVNLAFDERFTDYLQDQRHVRQEQIVAALAESYGRMGGWDPVDLEGLESLALMDGGTVRLEDVSAVTVWEPAATEAGARMAEMHRRMMGGGPLGPEQRLQIVVGDEVVGTAIVRFPEPGGLPQDRSFRASVNRLLLLGGVVAGVLALALGVVLAREATAPPRELTQTARALAAGDRSQRVSHEAPDELGEMARAFNQMADTIEEEDRLRRALAADVAQELRPPLTILRSQIEAMQDGVVSADGEALASLHEETMRLSRLVADLGTLASAEAAGFALERRQVRLAALVAESAREFAGPCEAQNVRLEIETEPVEAFVDPMRVHQILSNLLSNALKFTRPGDTVSAALSVDQGEVVLRVADTGPGIAADELPLIFDRFFRGRDSRARGSGIGLTVVRELARAHGGEIDVTSEPGRGTPFVVRFPASPSPRAPFTPPSHPAATVGRTGGDDR